MSNYQCPKCGIVRRDSPLGYFSGCVHLPAEVLRQDIEDLLRERQQAFHDLEQKHGCVLRIHGSFATGNATPDSDIDLTAKFAQANWQTFVIDLTAKFAQANWQTFVNLWRDLETLFGREVDLANEKSLVPLLRPRILQESRTIEQLLAGEIPPARKKSPLLYLSGIEMAAKTLKMGGSQSRKPMAQSLARYEMARLAKFSRRLIEVFPGFADAPWKPIRQVTRINRRLEEDPFSITHRDLAEARKYARKICKRLRLDPDPVLAQVSQLSVDRQESD